MSNVSEEQVRVEVRAWLAANWDSEMSLVTWRNKLADSGWGMPQWPEAWYGRGLPVRLARVVEEEFAPVGAVSVAKSGVRLPPAATLLEPRTDPQNKNFPPPIPTAHTTSYPPTTQPRTASP